MPHNKEVKATCLSQMVSKTQCLELNPNSAIPESKSLAILPAITLPEVSATDALQSFLAKCLCFLRADKCPPPPYCQSLFCVETGGS